MTKNDNSNQITKDLLRNQYWSPIEFGLDFNYVKDLPLDYVLEETGELLSSFGKHTKDNIFGLFGKEFKQALRNYYKALSPAPMTGYEDMHFQLQGKSRSSDDSYIPEEAMSQLNYRVILRICELLGTPNKVVLRAVTEYYQMDIKHFVSVEQFEQPAVYYVHWDKAFLLIQHSNYDQCMIFKLHFDNDAELRNYIDRSTAGLALNIKSKSFDIGLANPEFELASFPSYIQDIAKEVKEKIESRLEKGNNYYNLLVEGPIGTGSHS